jgi:hypothetical protein
MVKWLRERSRESGTPVSRLIEKMIEPHIKEGTGEQNENV